MSATTARRDTGVRWGRLAAARHAPARVAPYRAIFLSTPPPCGPFVSDLGLVGWVDPAPSAHRRPHEPRPRSRQSEVPSCH